MTPFEIALVPFPFTDLSSSKQRPCLILASYAPRSLPEHLIIAMMTSQVKKPHFPYDVLLNDWEEASLPLPTLVRISKIVTIDVSILRKKLGKLSLADSQLVKSSFSKLFASLI